MELHRYLEILRRRWLLLLLTPLMALTGVYLTRSDTTTYTAQARIYVGSRNLNTDLGGDTEAALLRVTRTFAVMLTSEPIARAAVESTGVDLTAQAVVSRTTSVVVPGTNLIRVAYTDTQPGRAQQVTNGIAESFVDRVQQFEPGIGDEGDLPALPAYVFERARYPAVPNPSNTASAYLTALLFGLVLAGGIAVLLDHLDITVRSPETLERKLGLPVLGIVQEHRPDLRDVPSADPRPNRPAATTDAATPRASLGRRRPAPWRPSAEEAQQRDEAFRIVRSSLEFATAHLDRRIVLLASAFSGEGKTSVCSALAVSLANAGRRVVAVDFDLRHPDLHARLGGHNETGVTDVLTEQRPLSECLQFIPTAGVDDDSSHGLYLLAAGPPVNNPAELLGTFRTSRLTSTLAETADVILLDVPPVLAVADAVIVARHANASVLVVEAGATTYPQVQRAHDTLVRSGVSVSGLVLNRLDERDVGDIYTYGYGNLPPEASGPRLAEAPVNRGAATGS